MSSFSVPPNERSYTRNKVTQDAEVIYPDERGIAEVIIRDMSVGGASIQLLIDHLNSNGLAEHFAPPRYG